MRLLIAGGLTRGLLDAGIEVVAGFARDPQRQATCERNNRHAKFDLSAIRDLCRAAMALPPPAVRHGEFLLAACAPCATAGASGSPRRSPRPPGPPAKSVLQPVPPVDRRDRGRNRINSCSLPIRYGEIRFKTATSQRINVTYNNIAALEKTGHLDFAPTTSGSRLDAMAMLRYE